MLNFNSPKNYFALLKVPSFADVPKGAQFRVPLTAMRKLEPFTNFVQYETLETTFYGGKNSLDFFFKKNVPALGCLSYGFPSITEGISLSVYIPLHLRNKRALNERVGKMFIH